MKKGQVRGLIILGVVLVAYLVLALVIPFKHTATFWVGFAFGIVGIIASAVGTFLAFKNGESAKSKFYGFPIARVALIYAIVQVIVSFIFMGIAKFCPSWVGIIVSVILLVLAVIGFIAADAMRDEIERQDVKLKTDVTAMRTLQSRINILAGNCDDPETKAAMGKLAEDFRFSDPVSSDAIADIEKQMSSLMDVIEMSVTDGDNENTKMLIKKLSGLLQERNRLCKLNK